MVRDMPALVQVIINHCSAGLGSSPAAERILRSALGCLQLLLTALGVQLLDACGFSVQHLGQVLLSNCYCATDQASLKVRRAWGAWRCVHDGTCWQCWPQAAAAVCTVARVMTVAQAHCHRL